MVTLLPEPEDFVYRSSLFLVISLRLHTLLTCPAWETLLVAMPPPT